MAAHALTLCQSAWAEFAEHTGRTYTTIVANLRTHPGVNGLANL